MSYQVKWEFIWGVDGPMTTPKTFTYIGLFFKYLSSLSQFIRAIEDVTKDKLAPDPFKLLCENPRITLILSFAGQADIDSPSPFDFKRLLIEFVNETTNKILEEEGDVIKMRGLCLKRKNNMMLPVYKYNPMIRLLRKVQPFLEVNGLLRSEDNPSGIDLNRLELYRVAEPSFEEHQDKTIGHLDGFSQLQDIITIVCVENHRLHSLVVNDARTTYAAILEDAENDSPLTFEFSIEKDGKKTVKRLINWEILDDLLK